MGGLDDIGRALAAGGPTDATLDRACEIVSARFGFDYVSIYRRSGDDLILGGSRGYPQPIERMSVDWGIVRGGMDECLPWLSAVISHEPSHRIDALRTEFLVPLVEIDKSVGLLVIGSTDDDPIGESDATVIGAIAARIGLALRLHADARALSERVSAMRRLETVAAPGTRVVAATVTLLQYLRSPGPNRPFPQFVLMDLKCRACTDSRR